MLIVTQLHRMEVTGTCRRIEAFSVYANLKHNTCMSCSYQVKYLLFYLLIFFCFRSAHQFCYKSKKRNQSFPKEKQMYCKLWWSNPHVLPLSGLKIKVKSSNHRIQKFALLCHLCRDGKKYKRTD